MLGVLLVVYGANCGTSAHGEADRPVAHLIPFLTARPDFCCIGCRRVRFSSVSLRGVPDGCASSPARHSDRGGRNSGPCGCRCCRALACGARLALQVQSFVNVVSLMAIVGLVFPLTALALAYGTYYPRFDSENAAQIPTSFGGLLFMMTAIVLIGVVAYGTGRPAARWVVAEHFGRERDPMAMAVPFLVTAAVCIATTIVPMMMARKRLAAIELG